MAQTKNDTGCSGPGGCQGEATGDFGAKKADSPLPGVMPGSGVWASELRVAAVCSLRSTPSSRGEKVLISSHRGRGCFTTSSFFPNRWLKKKKGSFDLILIGYLCDFCKPFVLLVHFATYSFLPYFLSYFHIFLSLFSPLMQLALGEEEGEVYQSMV